MIDPDEINDLEGAREAIRQLMKLVAGLRRQVDRLEQENKDLRDKLDDAKRAGKRQAGPHSKGAPKVEPKTPGQKPGHVAVNRAVPEKVDRSVRAQLPTHCECGGCIIQDDEKAQYQIDIPRPIPVTVTRFDVAIGHCDICAKRHQGRHPEQTSDALGAAGVQIGPNTLGLASELKHRHGLSYGGFATLLKSLTSGLRFARSAFARADQRVAAALQPTYEELIKRLRKAGVAYVDETGWRVNGRPAWLWVFTSGDIVVYVIDPTRKSAVVERVLTFDFAGVLKTDCLRTYDNEILAKIEQSKCLGHLIRRSREMEKSKKGRAVVFNREVTTLLRAALQLKARIKEKIEKRLDFPSADEVRATRQMLETGLDRLLKGNYSDLDNARLARLLRRHRGRLFNFLDHPDCEGTNNTAEQGIRPSVIIRKTNGCNRSDVGAEVHQIIASVLQTWSRQGVNFGLLVSALLRLNGRLALDFGPPAAATR